MKRTPIATALLLLAASTYHAVDAQTLKTREQVKAEWAEARDTGNLQADGESGLLLRDLHPGLYPQRAERGATRDEVKAELAQARRNGELLVGGESEQKLNERYPDRYAPVVVARGRTRAEVRAETAEAIRNGDMIASGELGLRENQLHPAQYPRALRVYAERAASIGAGPAATRQ